MKRTGVAALGVAILVWVAVAWRAPSPSNPLAELTIDSSPQGASVSLDGRVVGVTPVTVAPLEPGPVHVEISALGFVPYHETVVLRAGDRTFRSATLVAVPSAGGARQTH